MQGFSYSIFSIVAIMIHLIINFDLLFGRRLATVIVSRYRGFLLGVLFYYVADGLWGVFAGLGWIVPWYADTILFFLSLVAFVFMWSRFVSVYLDLGRRTERILSTFGFALLAVNIALLVANFFTDCFFHFNEAGKYIIGSVRDPVIFLLVAYNVLIAGFVLAKAIRSRDAVRRRSFMVLLFCITITLAIGLQILIPLTPFTSFGCLISNCFFHVFVIQDEQAARHTAELEQALTRARSAEKARSMFFSIVSHDIRTPLNAILGYSELLRNGIEDPAERNEALDSIRASGTTLLQLVNDVLDLAKLDSGKTRFRPEPVLLNRLANDVFASFRMAAAEKGIELVNRTADVPTILLDERHFRQILFNLVGNAVKCTERGTITLAASFAGSKLEVAVSDTGCGIPSDMLRRILDPFVQVYDPTHAADRAAGTGLGLSICKGLVEGMGGELVVESELGKGSTFRILLPGVAIAGKKPEAVAGPNPDVLLKNPPKRVLIVDDSTVNRSVLTAYLKRAGVASVDHACDGGEALSELDAAVKSGHPHDFVFSDFWMPNMNGSEFVERLRSDPRFRTLPVYLVTADTDNENDPRNRLFTGILLKPLTYAKLLETLSASSRA